MDFICFDCERIVLALLVPMTPNTAYVVARRYVISVVKDGGWQADAQRAATPCYDYWSTNGNLQQQRSWVVLERVFKEVSEQSGA